MTLRIYSFRTRYEQGSNTIYIYIRLPVTEADKYKDRENDLMRKSMTFTGMSGKDYFQLSDIKFIECNSPANFTHEKIILYEAKFNKMEMLYPDRDNPIVPKLNEDIEVIP